MTHKESNNYTMVGRTASAPYAAFGDDSQFGEFAAFAYVLIPRTRLTVARRKLEQIKKDHGIPPSLVLHCRTLFNGYQREKLGLSHLNTSNVRAIVMRTITLLNEVNGRLHYATQNISELSNKLGGSLQMHPHNGSASFQVSLTVEAKGVLGLLANMCFPLAPGVNGPSASQCEIFVSEDKTKISFIGNGQQQAHNLYSGFLDSSDGLLRLNQKIVVSDADPLLQLADIFAYLCSHAASGAKSDTFWREQLGRVARWFKAG